ncbi:hypothetical protein TNCV_2891471 [Trichonephila clavipes]|nr:hypothetical protein TNCV_2891471 [Trichonephila clavipes]
MAQQSSSLTTFPDGWLHCICVGEVLPPSFASIFQYSTALFGSRDIQSRSVLTFPEREYDFTVVIEDTSLLQKDRMSWLEIYANLQSPKLPKSISDKVPYRSVTKYDEDVKTYMACDAEDWGLQLLNDDEIVTSMQESDPVDDETDEDEDNNYKESSKGPSKFLTRFPC